MKNKSSPTRPLYLKPQSTVRLNNHGNITKILTENEEKAYEYLALHIHLLSSEDLKIIVPSLLTYNPKSRLATLEYLGQFPDLNPFEAFGAWEGYTETYLRGKNKAFQLMRTMLPIKGVYDCSDYEGIDNGAILSLRFIKADMKSNVPRYLNPYWRKICDLAEASQKTIATLKQYPSHRDPNPNNYHISVPDASLMIVDWETFGLARAGYEEGRQLSYLALNQSTQDMYTKLVKVILSERSWMYFWRTACMRAFREASFFERGHYDTRLSGLSAAHKQELLSGLRTLMDRSIAEWERCLKHGHAQV